MVLNMKHIVKQETFLTPWMSELKGYFREDTSDRNTLLSCIVEDEYRLGKVNKNSGIILDLGSHLGAFALAACSKGYNVFACEMFPENNHMFWANVIANNFQDQVVLYENALSPNPNALYQLAYYSDTVDEVGRVHEYIGTLIKRKKDTSMFKNGKDIKVPTITLDNIFLLNNIDRVDLLKCDIEGSEWGVFRNTHDNIINKIDRIAIELDAEDGIKTTTTDFLKIIGDQFVDYSPTYFPEWCSPGLWTHAYFINKRIL